MSEKKDGGPAFPWGSDYSTGMSLRDYFAAQAMVALIAKSPLSCTYRDGEDDVAAVIAANVTGSYRYADAMLKQRAK